METLADDIRVLAAWLWLGLPVLVLWEAYKLHRHARRLSAYQNIDERRWWLKGWYASRNDNEGLRKHAGR